MQTFLFDDEVEALTEFEAGGALSDDRLRTLERFATTEFGQQMLSERAPLYQDSEPTIPSSKPQLKFEVVEEEPPKPTPAPAAAPAEQPRRAPTRNPNSRQRPEDMPQDQFQLSIYGPRGMRGSAWLDPFDGLPIDATQQEIKQSLLDRYNDINVVLTEDEMATFDDLMRDDTEAASRFFDGAARIVPGLWDLYMGGMKEGYAGALRRYGMGAFGDPRDQVKQDLATAGETGRKVVIQTRQLWNFFSQMFGDVMAANRGTEIVRQELAAAGQLTGNNRADMPIIQQEIQRRREAGDPVFGADQDQQDFQRRYQNYAFNRKLDRAFAGLTSYEQDGVEIMEAPDVVGGTTFSVGGQQPMPSVSTGGAMIFDPVNIAAGYAGAFTKARLLHRFAATSGPAFAGVEKGAAATISFAARKGEQLADFAQRKTGLTANQLTAISGAGATLGLGLSQVAGVNPETGMPTSSAAASFGRALFLVSAPLPAMRAAGVILKTTKEAAGAAAAVSAEAKAGALGIRSALSPTDQASAIRAARTASAQELLSTGAVPKQYSRYMSPGGAQQAADSTLKRVAQNTQNPEALRRAARFADQIGVTTAARVGDDLFSGAVVGGAMSVPFAVAAPDPETAGAIVGGGVAFGTAGNLIGGKFARMQEFIDADIARMMVDVNAQGGDAVAMFGMPKDQLIRLAGTQGMLANKGTDLIPLRTEDYVANVPEASDGIYMPPNPQTGQRRQVFVDLGHSSLRDGTVRVSDNGDGWFNVRVEGDGGYAYAFKTSDPAQLAVKDGDKVKAYQPLNKKSPASMIAGEEFIHAVMDSDMFDGEHKVDLRALIDQEYGRDGVLARKRDYAARTVDERIASGTEDNVGFIYADDLEAKQVAEGTKTIAQIRRERGKTTKQRDEMIDETIAELDQASIDRTGDPDAWIKDEILGQTWASLSQSLDLNRLRRGQNPELVTARAAEGVMVVTSRALELFGLKTDAGTGRPLSPPSAVFRENPLTISPVLKKRLTEYVRNYDRYLAGLEDAGSAQPRGVPIARSNSPKDLANSPFVKLRRNPRTGLMENDFMFVDATGTPVFKEQADINNTEAQRRKQVATLGGDKILPSNSTEFGPRRLDSGRVEISGPTLPDKFFLFNHFPEHVRDFARQFQTGRADGMSFLVDYNAIGSRSGGTYRVRNLGNVRAIQREFVPTGFIRSSTDHLLVAGIDMNSVRAAAMKAINKGELGLFNNDMTTLTKDLVAYLDNHKNGRPGEATIGIAKRDMLNGLIGTGTAVQRKANPLYSDLNRSGSVRTFRLDRVNEAKPTGRTGLHFDYDKLKNNRMPRTGAATLVDDGPEAATGGNRGQAMPDTDQPRRYVSMEKFIEEAGDELGEVLPNAYKNLEFNDDNYPTHLVSFSDARNSMYRSRVPSKEFFDWLHSDEVMDGLVFDEVYTPARPGEGAGHTRESYQALIDRLRAISLKPSKQKATGGTRGQAMPDVAPAGDQGVATPAGTRAQLTDTARKALPRLPRGASSVPKLVIKREGKADAVVDGGSSKNWQGFTGEHTMPLPNIKLDKVRGVSFSKQDIYDVARTDRARAQADAQQSVRAAALAAADPMKFVDPVGYSEIMRASGVVGDILIPPSGLKLMLTDPAAFVGLLDGGFHGKRTAPGTRAAAMQGLDGVTEMRQLVGGKPSQFNTALHHYWGTLSKQLDVINQEAAWMRTVLDPAIIEAIDMSVQGKFNMLQKDWEALVARALDGTQGDFRGKGNNAKANANSFYKALVYHNGRWDEVAALYANNNAIDMRAQFNALGHGKVGMKNKVQGFVGLSFGVKGSVLDRWRFVDLYLPDVMKLTGAATPEQYFKYVGAQKVIPQDPIGIYKNYGTLENGNPAFSLALYNSLDSVAQVAINNSPELRNYLGAHADPGGLHWATWNAIKNEAVGHSSLDITKNFVRKYGRDGTASDFAQFMRTAEGFVEGSNDAGQTIRLSLKNGAFSYGEQ
jgi:hypothetical protein